jgi:probable addiction module antidote protein
MVKAQLENEIMTLKKNDIADHLNAAIKGDDVSAFPQALGVAVHAFGVKELSDLTGYTHQKINRATRSKAKPRFETVHNIVHGMNLAIKFVPANKG